MFYKLFDNRYLFIKYKNKLKYILLTKFDSTLYKLHLTIIYLLIKINLNLKLALI